MDTGATSSTPQRVYDTQKEERDTEILFCGMWVTRVLIGSQVVPLQKVCQCSSLFIYQNTNIYKSKENDLKKKCFYIKKDC